MDGKVNSWLKDGQTAEQFLSWLLTYVLCPVCRSGIGPGEPCPFCRSSLADMARYRAILGTEGCDVI